MTKAPAIIVLTVCLSGCAAFQGSNGPGSASSTYDANVGDTGSASDAMSNGGSTSTSIEEQRIKQQNGNTAPTSYMNQTHIAS